MPQPSNPPGSADSPQAQPQNRVRRSWLARWLIRALALAAVGLACAILFERLWPQLYITETRLGSLVHFAAFLLRTFEFHVSLAAFALACAALLLRARRTAIFAGVVAAVALIPVAALWLPTQAGAPKLADSTSPGVALAANSGLSGNTPSATGPRPLRVLAMNLLIGLENLDAALAEVRRIDPDVIGFIEYNPAAHRVLFPALKSAYPHVIDAGSTGAFGQAVYSRLPLLDEFGRTREEGNAGWQPATDLADEPEFFLGPQIRTVVRSHDGSTVAVRFVHLTSPSLPSRLANQRRELPFLLERLADDRARWPNLVVAGDFNAPTNSDLIAAIRDAGFEESTRALGLGPSTTWPRRTFLKHFPNVRIDHVFVAGPPPAHHFPPCSPLLGLMFLNAGRSGDFGSDHRGVWADVLPFQNPPPVSGPSGDQDSTNPAPATSTDPSISKATPGSGR